MSALDGKITIEKELRPCIVHIPAARNGFRLRKDKIKNNVVRKEENVKALFHCWNYRSQLVDAWPMIDGHPGGQVSGTFAIVEYEDGTIHEVEPTQIRFVDNATSEYVFPEMEEKEK